MIGKIFKDNTINELILYIPIGFAGYSSTLALRVIQVINYKNLEDLEEFKSSKNVEDIVKILKKDHNRFPKFSSMYFTEEGDWLITSTAEKMLELEDIFSFGDILISLNDRIEGVIILRPYQEIIQSMLRALSMGVWPR